MKTIVLLHEGGSTRFTQSLLTTISPEAFDPAIQRCVGKIAEGALSMSAISSLLGMKSRGSDHRSHRGSIVSLAFRVPARGPAQRRGSTAIHRPRPRPN